MNGKRRIFLIDIVRVFCALIVYMRHSITIYGCSYGEQINDFVLSYSLPSMTVFFIVSGFAIHYQHNEDVVTSDWTRHYIKKRLITVVPTYLLVVFIWPIANPSQIKDWALLFPIDLFGVQTSYRSLFGILHNGGTWFVSCILIAYLFYPIIKSSFESKRKCVPYLLVFVLYYLLIYSNVIIPIFNLDSLYSNPLARTAEFAIGVSFAEIVFRKDTIIIKQEKKQILSYLNNHREMICTIVAITIVGFAIAKMNETEFGLVTDYLLIPLVSLMLFVASGLKSIHIENSKVLSALSGMTYPFYMVQLFLWDITNLILEGLRIEESNTMKICMSFAICIIIAFLVWRFYEKPLRKLLKRKFLSAYYTK